MILVDTSIWIEIFSARNQIKLDDEQLLALATCPPVIQELLQGLPTTRNSERVVQGILSLPCIKKNMTLDTFIHAADIYRACLKRGLTIRSSIDCLIAACAIEQDVPVWHKDRDFTAIAKVTDLRCLSKLPT